MVVGGRTRHGCARDRRPAVVQGRGVRWTSKHAPCSCCVASAEPSRVRSHLPGNGRPVPSATYRMQLTRSSASPTWPGRPTTLPVSASRTSTCRPCCRPRRDQPMDTTSSTTRASAMIWAAQGLRGNGGDAAPSWAGRRCRRRSQPHGDAVPEHLNGRLWSVLRDGRASRDASGSTSTGMPRTNESCFRCSDLPLATASTEGARRRRADPALPRP